MVAVVQRVSRAQVEIDGEVVGRCGKGLMILLGVAASDDETDASVLASKISKLRVFCDENDKMNLSVKDIGGSALVVSQFTLLADTSHGNRPSFFNAGEPSHANALYERFMELLRGEGVTVESGRFGADMQVTIFNDGPVTLVLNSEDYLKSKK